MRRLTVYLLVIACLTISNTSVFSAEKPKVDAKALFDQKCSVCHSMDRPKSNKKTANEWENTVMQMKNVNGVPITDEEAKVIIDYLSKNYSK